MRGNVIPAGTVVCVHLFLTSKGDDESWKLDYDVPVLAITRTGGQLAATDGLSAGPVDYGPTGRRGLGEDGDSSITSGGTRAHIKLDDGRVNSVRIFLDCSS